MAEVRLQMTDGRSQTTDDRKQKSDNRRMKSEKLEDTCRILFLFNQLSQPHQLINYTHPQSKAFFRIPSGA